jgi:hypothetical protein
MMLRWAPHLHAENGSEVSAGAVAIESVAVAFVDRGPRQPYAGVEAAHLAPVGVFGALKDDGAFHADCAHSVDIRGRWRGIVGPRQVLVVDAGGATPSCRVVDVGEPLR